jgi:hypothetical protein
MTSNTIIMFSKLHLVKLLAYNSKYLFIMLIFLVALVFLNNKIQLWVWEIKCKFLIRMAFSTNHSKNCRHFNYNIPKWVATNQPSANHNLAIHNNNFRMCKAYLINNIISFNKQTEWEFKVLITMDNQQLKTMMDMTNSSQSPYLGSNNSKRFYSKVLKGCKMYYLVIFVIHNKMAKDWTILVRCTEYVLIAIHKTNKIIKRITSVSKDVLMLIWSLHELMKEWKEKLKLNRF